MAFSSTVLIRSIIFTHQLAKRLSVRTDRLVNFGVDQYFSARFAYAGHQNSTHRIELPDLPLPGVALANDTRPEWSSILREMGGIWTTSFGGLVILAPLSVALLQIDSVGTSRWGQAFAVATFMVALAGLISSVLSISILGGAAAASLGQDTLRLRWLEASRQPEEVRSIQFWSCLVLPVVCAAWSLIFATATVLYIAVSPITSSSEKGKISKFEMIAYAFSVAFISALNGYFFFQVYCLKQIMA